MSLGGAIQQYYSRDAHVCKTSYIRNCSGGDCCNVLVLLFILVVLFS